MSKTLEYIKVSGQVLSGYEEVVALFAKQLQKNGGGAALCVYRGGKPVLDIWGGVRNKANEPWLAKTPSVSFSTTKGVVSTLLHWLMEQEGLDYDLPVSSIWPEFRSEGKNRITIKDLLAHEAGLFRISNLIDHVDRMLDWRYMTDMLAKASPSKSSKQAGKQAYHGLTFGWLVGEVIRRLSGKLPGELLQEVFVQPMELSGAMLGVPKRKLSSVAELVDNPVAPRTDDSDQAFSSRNSLKRGVSWLGKRSMLLYFNKALILDVFAPKGMKTFQFDSAKVLQAQIPAANGVFDARSLAKMYSMIAMKGELEGRRYLSENRVNKLLCQQNRGLDGVVRLPMGWRLGYHRVLNFKQPLTEGVAHYGFGGSGGWADVGTGTSVGFVVNAGRGTPFGDFRLWELNRKLLSVIAS